MSFFNPVSAAIFVELELFLSSSNGMRLAVQSDTCERANEGGEEDDCGKGERLLIVEDDRDMRSLLCDEVGAIGYQLREAGDGDKTVLAVRQSVPDLIVTDLRMPAG